MFMYAILPIVYFVTSTIVLILSRAVYVRVIKKYEPEEEKAEDEEGQQ